MHAGRMRRGRRGRWTCALLTLVLCGLLVRSLVHPGVALYGPFGYLGVADGVLAAGWWPMPAAGQPRMPFHVAPFSFVVPGLRWGFHAVGSQSGGWGYVPLWASLVPAAAVTVLLWRPRRAAPPACAACGYDLTGNVSGRCPECGAAVGRADAHPA